MSDEIIKPPATCNNRLAPELNYFINKIKVKFHGSCLKQDKITYTFATMLNIYIVYNFDPTLENCLIDAVELTKNADIDKYKHSGYGTAFDSAEFFFVFWWGIWSKLF